MKDRVAYLRAYRAAHKAEQAAHNRSRPAVHHAREIIGIDGEGLTEEGPRPSPDFMGPMRGVHKYLYMAAWGTDRKVSDLDLEPLYQPGHHDAERTIACLEFLLALPHDALVLGFSLGYDYTKILEGLDDGTLFRIARPETRQGKNGPRSLRWSDWSTPDGRHGNYKLNYIKGKFSVAKVVTGEHNIKCARPFKCKGCLIVRHRAVWDIFAFFQSSFIAACKSWKVVTDEEYEELRAMKARRSVFTRDDWESVKTYCGQECRKMALLGQRLLAAHEEAGLKLTSYYGAGSTAAQMLKSKFDAKSFIGKPLPEMIEAIACGFFGGRFEVSRIGPVRQKCWSYDIASAYPYQFTFLPCLACGEWNLSRGGDGANADRESPASGTFSIGAVAAATKSLSLQAQIEASEVALVRYRLPPHPDLAIDPETQSSPMPWGPFPLRAYGLNVAEPGNDGPFPSMSEYPSNGSILYPVSSGGGWVYRDEFLTAQKHFPNVEAVEAWIYTKKCGHQPFNDTTGERSTMPEQYILRLQWGKEGRGIVVKLGTNSCYGKAAQSVGNAPPYQCYLWAGMVTSGCRAQLLDLMMSARDPSNILMTATDGIVSLEELTLPEPRDTGTAEAARVAGKSMLGAWETKELADGVMIIRPGIAFPLDLEKEIEVKARGIGKTVLANHRKGVLAQWAEKPGETYHLSRTMFFGMKSATDPPSRKNAYPSRRANYGTWASQPQKVSYSPFPKRPRAHSKREQKRIVAGGTLRTWAFGLDVVSAAYDKLLDVETRTRLRLERRASVGDSEEARAEKQFDTLMSEQPDREEESNDFRE